VTWTRQLLDGIGGRITDLAIGTYDPTDTAGDVVLGSLPPELDHGIALRAYGQQPDHQLADVVQPVQMWLRGTLAYVTDTADALFDGFEGVERLVLGGISVPWVELYSDLGQGVDQSGREERALNFYFHAMRTTASRPD
jgi:hypothetical protein